MHLSATNTPPASISPSKKRHRWRAAATQFASRLTGLPPWVVLVQLFIGLGWLRAFAEKAIDTQWWTGAAIEDFIGSQEGVTLGWYQPFVDSVVLPAAPAVALIVIVAQLLAGLSLTTSHRVGVGLAIGIFLNLHFMSAGAVTPSAFYLLAQGAVGLWMAERSRARACTNRLLVVATAAVFVAAANVPFISTLHPHEVIDDPAIMYVLAGSLTALTSLLAMHARSVTARAATAEGAVDYRAFSAQLG